MAALSFEILDCVNGRIGFDTGYYRIRVGGSTIKYLAFDHYISDIPDFRGENLAFSTVPPGDWNVGKLEHEVRGRSQFKLGSTDWVELKTIPTWHQSFVDFNDLPEAQSGFFDGELQFMGKMYCASYKGQLGFDQVIVDHDWYPCDLYGPEHNTAIYALINDHNIAPKFVAHVTENHSRVIGYMVERVPGRAATPNDLPACQAVLRRLHAQGVAHGHIDLACFLVTDDGAYIHDFGPSFQTDDPAVFANELDTLIEAFKSMGEELVEVSQGLIQKAD